MYSLLLTIKFIIYTNLIKVEHNLIPVILTSSLIGALILSLIYRSKLKHKKKYAFIFYAGVSILMLANAAYFRQFNALTSIILLKQTKQLNTIGESIKVLLNLKVLALIIDLPIMLIYPWIKKTLKLEILRKKGLSHITQDDTSSNNSALVIPTSVEESPASVIPTNVEGSPTLENDPNNCPLSIVFNNVLRRNQFGYPWKGNCQLKNVAKYINQPKILLTSLILILCLSAITGQLKSIISQDLFSYHIMDIKDHLFEDKLAEASEVLSPAELQELISRRNLEDGKLTGIGKGKNLIVIQVEALQNFVINYRYNGQEITPNLNELINNQSSIYYNNYYHLTARGNTSDAEFVSLNSMYPSIDVPTYMKYQDNTFYGLPKLLKDNGYTPWAFHGYKKDFWNREHIYPRQGFRRYISEDNFIFDDTIGFGLKDEDFFKQSLNYLKVLDKKDDNPFFAFMITLSSHTPFGLPEEYKALDLGEELDNTLVGNYLEAIHYTDKQLGIFINNLKREGLYEDTVIAIYGDHFAIPYSNEPESEIMTDLLGKEYGVETMMNVPLIIHVPGEGINETVTNIGSQLDFYPTMANIMGVKIEKGLIFGRDLNNYKGKNQVNPLMFMEKGSFITDDIMFELSRDQIFDHSTAKSIKTGQELNIYKYKPTTQKAMNEIMKSNYILKMNLLKDLL